MFCSFYHNASPTAQTTLKRLKITIYVDYKVHYESLLLCGQVLKAQAIATVFLFPSLFLLFVNNLLSPIYIIKESHQVSMFSTLSILNLLRSTSHLPPKHLTEVSKKWQMAGILCFNNISLKVPNIWFIKITGMLPVNHIHRCLSHFVKGSILKP